METPWEIQQTVLLLDYTNACMHAEMSQSHEGAMSNHGLLTFAFYRTAITVTYFINLFINEYDETAHNKQVTGDRRLRTKLR